MRTWIGFSLILFATTASAQERRAPAPKFTQEQLRAVFFDKLKDGLRGERPTLSSLRQSSSAPTTDSTVTHDLGANTSNRWTQLIGPTAIEDEIKRLKFHYDSLITTPSAFSSGGFQQARLDLTALATLFAVISQYDGEVRWKNHAGAASGLLARTAFNCKAGSRSVYNEAKRRKADLQDLISGSGIAASTAEPITDWSNIADRSPLMEYAESLIGTLADATNNEQTIKREAATISTNTELIAMLGEVLSQTGMDDAEDEDYVKLSRAMSGSARELAVAIEQADAQKVQSAVGDIRKRCDACHNQYR